MRSVALAIAMAFATGTGLSGTAYAQTDESAGRRAFRLGQAHYENGEFAEAAAQFEEAYRLSGRARLLYNAYLAYRDMQDLPNSARTLRRFLQEGTDLSASERDQLQARLEAIERVMAESAAEPSEPQPTTQPQTETQPVATTAQTPPVATPTAGGEVTVEPAPVRDGGGGFSPSPVGFIVGGAGVALVVGAIVTGVMSSGDLSTLEERCPMDRCPDDPELRDAQSRGATLATVTDVLWITGAVAIAAGVTLVFVLQDDSGSEASAGMACTPDGCFGSVRGTF